MRYNVLIGVWEGGKIMQNPEPILFMLEEQGRSFTQQGMDRKIREFIKKEGIVSAKAAMGPSINDPRILLDQIQMKETAGEPWAIAYFYGGKYGIELGDELKAAFVTSLKQALQEPAPHKGSHEICRELLLEQKAI